MPAWMLVRCGGLIRVHLAFRDAIHAAYDASYKIVFVCVLARCRGTLFSLRRQIWTGYLWDARQLKYNEALHK